MSMDTLKKAGLMTQHLALFQHMQNVRGLTFLAQIMEEQQEQQAIIVGPDDFIVITTQIDTVPQLTSNKGYMVVPSMIYTLLKDLKGFEAEQYTVNRQELAHLNAQAIAHIEQGDDLKAFEATMTKIAEMGQSSPAPSTTPEAATTEPEQSTPTREGRQRRHDARHEAPETPAEPASDTPAA